MKTKREKVISVTAESYQKFAHSLSDGMRDFPPSHQVVFFDYLKTVAAYEEFGMNRGKLVEELEEAERNDLFTSVQTLLPWMTDVFMFGILAGEEAQNTAKRELLALYAEFPETAADAQRALSLDRMHMVEYSMRGQQGDEEAVLATVRRKLDETLQSGVVCDLSEIRWYLKYLPTEERERQMREVLDMLGRLVGTEDADKRDRTSARCFCGKYELIPAVLGVKDVYTGLRKLPLPEEGIREFFVRNKCLWQESEYLYQAELTNALKRCSNMRMSDEITARRLKGAADVILNANDRKCVLSVCDVSDEVKERIANGILGVELLWTLAQSAARRLNNRGSGMIPAFRLAGRIGRDGREIEASDTAFNSVDQGLDDMVQKAVCQLLAGREVNGVNIVTYEAFREYLEGEFNDKYLMALIDNAVANKKYLVLRPKDAPPVVVVPIDTPINPDDDKDEITRKDIIPDPKSGPPDDYNSFALGVVKRHAPRLWRYLSLVELGISASDIKRLRDEGMSELADKYDPGSLVSKGDALKMVGAKTPHLVERERAALLKALKEVKGRDFQEMAKKLNAVLGE